MERFFVWSWWICIAFLLWRGFKFNKRKIFECIIFALYAWLSIYHDIMKDKRKPFPRWWAWENRKGMLEDFITGDWQNTVRRYRVYLIITSRGKAKEEKDVITTTATTSENQDKGGKEDEKE